MRRFQDHGCADEYRQFVSAWCRRCVLRADGMSVTVSGHGPGEEPMLSVEKAVEIAQYRL